MNVSESRRMEVQDGTTLKGKKKQKANKMDEKRVVMFKVSALCA